MKNRWKVCTQIPYYYFPPKINHRFFKKTTKKQLEKDKKFSKAFINDITSTFVSREADITTEEDSEMNAEIGGILSLVSSKQRKTKETNIWIPKPRGHLCHVCKIHFEDYLEHINTPEHRKSWRESTFTFNISYFSELIGKYNP